MRIKPDCVDPPWFRKFDLPVPNINAGDQFGSSVDVCGDTVVVGAPLVDGEIGDDAETSNSAPGAGAVYVFARRGNDWVQQACLRAATKHAGAEFGRSVAISKNSIVVGAPFESVRIGSADSDFAGGRTVNAGAVYVFIRMGKRWVQQAHLKAVNVSNGQAFGESVDISMGTLLVGAPGEASGSIGINGDQTDRSAIHSGAAYVFVRKDERWVQEAYLKASNTDELDQFGSAVAVCGDTVVIGAPNEDSKAADNPNNNSLFAAGAVYVFVRDEARSWSQQAYLKAYDADAGDHFGFSVALADERMVVGAPFKNSHGVQTCEQSIKQSVSNNGAAYVFERYEDTWLQYANLKETSMDVDHKFGYSVSIDNHSIVVGAPLQSRRAIGTDGDSEESSGRDAGAVYLFVRSEDGLWHQQVLLKTLSSDIGSQFGCAVVVCERSIAVGARFGSSHVSNFRFDALGQAMVQSGKVCLFEQPN